MAPNKKTGPTQRPPVVLQLAKKWTFDDSKHIGGGGGFGEIFEGKDESGLRVAVKRVRRVTPGLATGEIRIARTLMSRPSEHVIPILDAGEDPSTGLYYIVMPRAEESLQDRLERSSPLDDDEAMAVLMDVLTGLQDMGRIVHGDLKPDNVLFHEGKWKLADMGIARMLDEEPPQLSHRMFVSEPYAAPEQWRFKPATRATDVYAFGCLAYAVLTGEPPFPGPTQKDYCVQHLKETPRILPASKPVAALVQMCLTKDRASRPSIDTAIVLLKRAWAKR